MRNCRLGEPREDSEALWDVAESHDIRVEA
jgi:hypothetical protein